MAAQGPPQYRVVYSGRHREQVRRLGERAFAAGLALECADALQSMNDALGDDPATWGDPQNRLPHVGWTIYHRIHWYLNIYYAIDEGNQTVYLKDILALSSSPLAGE
jgi:hypothetical protein